MTRRGILRGAGLAIPLATLWAEPALAAQCANVSFSPASVTVPNWNPINPAAQQATFTMTVTRLKNTTSDIRLMFLDSNDTALPARLGVVSAQSGPRYQVLDASGQDILYPKNSDVMTLKGQPTFKWQNKNSNNTISASFRIVVPANTGNADFYNGSYGETLNYAIQCLNNGANTNLVDGPVSGPAMSLTIPNLVSLTTASPQTMDFQQFTSLSQQLNVGLRSTGPVNVAIDSTYKLKMVRSGASSPYPDNSTIPYLMSLEGTNVASLPAALTKQRTGVAGGTYALVLQLNQTPSGKIAGSYSDTITLTLTPGT